MTGTLVAQILANGVMLSLMYVIIASGLAVIFSIMGIVNFAHGEFYMLGAYFSFWIAELMGAPFFAAIVLAILATALLGILIERGVFRPLAGRPATNALVASCGLALILQNLTFRIGGQTDKWVDPPFIGVLHIGDAVLSWERLFMLPCSLAVIACLYLFLKMTKTGQAMRATAQDAEVAAAQGVNTDRISTLAFALGCALAGVAGALMSPILAINPWIGAGPVLKAFIVITIGGLGSIPGALAGGFILGFLDSVGGTLLGGPEATILAFILLVIFLLLRPQGLVGHAG